MTYSYYHNVIKGTAPKNAPTYQPPEVERDGNDGESWICTVCGYIYNAVSYTHLDVYKSQAVFNEKIESFLCKNAEE